MIFDIVIFVLVLGLLVFFHELGHFLAAKAMGVYCIRFSLGMPPRVWGMQIGETDYCIGLLPIGGYVNMAGQEDAPKSEEEREHSYGHVPPERWFSNKAVWQRAVIVVAGPAMNLVLAVLLYGIVAGYGAWVPESEVDSRIGRVEPGSPAAQAPLYAVGPDQEPTDISPDQVPATHGWQTGDRILSTDGRRVSNISDVAIAAVLHAGADVRVVLERTGADGEVQRFVSFVRPERLGDNGHPRFGVAPFFTALVGSTLMGAPAHDHGLQPGDVIERLDGERIDAPTFTDVVANWQEDDPPLTASIRRGDAGFDVEFRPGRRGNVEGIVFEPQVDYFLELPPAATPKIAIHSGWFRRDARAEAFFDRTPFEAGDVVVDVVAVGGPTVRLHDLEDRRNEPVTVTVERKTGWIPFFRETVQTTFETTVDTLILALTDLDENRPPTIAHIERGVAAETGLQRGDIIEEIDGRSATVGLLRQIEQQRPGDEVTAQVRRPAPWFRLRAEDEVYFAELPVASIGSFGVIWDTPIVFHREPWHRVVPTAFRETATAFSRTVQTVVMLVTGNVSARDLGGPVMIYQVTTRAARLGYSWLLTITAFISVNLCVFNLLPLPVLDGGLLAVLGIEGIRGKPANPRLLERVQQVGLALIIMLILFVTYNDLARIFFGASF